MLLNVYSRLDNSQLTKMIQIVDLYTIKKGFKLGLKLAHSKQAMGCMATHYKYVQKYVQK